MVSIQWVRAGVEAEGPLEQEKHNFTGTEMPQIAYLDKIAYLRDTRFLRVILEFFEISATK